jgi:hypothetical protein
VNPFLAIYGPRPETWWAVCSLCGKTSQPRFRSEAEAEDWDHDCHTSAIGHGTIKITVELSLDDPPTISWKGELKAERFKELRQALNVMGSWSIAGDPSRRWEDEIRSDWERRRRMTADLVIAEFERTIEMPYACPECGQRCKTVGGLKNHMRACWRVDPFKFKRGEYADAMVPGGAP